jgi:hypothetical protein
MLRNTKFKTTPKLEIPQRVQTKIDEYKKAKEDAKAKKNKK